MFRKLENKVFNGRVEYFNTNYPFQGHMDPNLSYLFVHGDKAIAALICRSIPYDKNDCLKTGYIHIATICIDPSYKGGDYPSQMLIQLMNDAREGPFKYIGYYIEKNNTSCKNLFYRFGFRPTESAVSYDDGRCLQEFNVKL